MNNIINKESNRLFGRSYLPKALLDSNLITQTNKILFNVKIYKCGNYLQIYKYTEKHMKIDKSCCQETEVKQTNNENKDYTLPTPTYKEIRIDNVMRSRLCIERIIKTNQENFLTFITLTFKENITNVKQAHSVFNSWTTYIRRFKQDFKYVCVPEFQKRGAVHYHLLTNLSYIDERFIEQTITKRRKGNKMFYLKKIKYWNYGKESYAQDMKDFNVVGYLSKYMNKDIDNRLFGRRRYFYSKNLKVPKAEYLNTDNIKTLEYLNKLVKDKVLCYTNRYIRKYINEEIEFKEYNEK